MYQVCLKKRVGYLVYNLVFNLENKVFERLINPEDQSINIEPRQGYGIKERKALEKAIDRLNQLAQ